MKKTCILFLALILIIQFLFGCGDDGKNEKDGIVPANVTIQLPEGL